MGATAGQVRAWFAGNHPRVCGHPAGYKQFDRVRRRLVALEDPEPFDCRACREAWANKEVVKRRLRREGQDLEAKAASLPREHGTARGLNQHYKERERLRTMGKPDWALPPVCPACRRAGAGPVAPRELAPLEPLPGEDAPHGTAERLSYEQLVRRRLRSARAPQAEIDAAVCETCEAAAKVRRVRRQIELVDQRLASAS